MVKIREKMLAYSIKNQLLHRRVRFLNDPLNPCHPLMRDIDDVRLRR